MAWIESHQEIGRHPKTRKLARKLGVSVPCAVGHLHLLWHWCLDFADDGDLSGFGWDEIADGAMWEGDPAAFGDALIECGFLDADEDMDDVSVHDWDVYTGRIQAAREANRERQKRYRERQKSSPDSDEQDSNAHVTVTSPSRNGATVPNRTVPNPTKQKPERVATGADAPSRSDPLFEAVAEECYGNGQQYGTFAISKTDRGRINESLPDIRAVEATVEDIHEFAKRYRARSPDMDLTPQTYQKGITRFVNARRAKVNGHATTQRSSEEFRRALDAAGVE